MKAFEFHFNPKIKEGLIFESFCLEPENVYEKRIGSLYMIGLLKNVLPRNVRFVDNLAKIIKENYYKLTVGGPEKSLRESLKEANKFLEQISKKGDVSWLGNLTFAVLSFKNFVLNFTKIGEVKIFLLREGKIIDIDKRLNFQEIEPYPLKVFGNIVSGKLAEGDLILVLTKEVFELFEARNLLSEIAKIFPFDEKKLKLLFREKEKDFLQISGICLTVLLTKEEVFKKREILLPELKKLFSFKGMFIPFVNFFGKFLKKPKFLTFQPPKLKFPPLKLLRLPVFVPKKPSTFLNKRKILIFSLILILVLGFFIFQREREIKTKDYEMALSKVQEKYNQAENFLKLKEQNLPIPREAYLLLEESWKELLPLREISPKLPQDLREKISVLDSKISIALYKINNLVEISEPKVFFDFGPIGFVPGEMIISEEKLYFFNNVSKNLYKIEKDGRSNLIKSEKYFEMAGNFGDSILFFSKPKNLIIFKDNELSTTSLAEPYTDFSFDEFYVYNSNLYFLDKKLNEIIKYPYLDGFRWGTPQLWFSPREKPTIEIRSMAIDGSVWILTADNSISRYRVGKKQEALKLNLFPPLQNFSKIFTSNALPYLYILEPPQKRIIILNKKGDVIKQFRSEKFDNLLNFAVSEDGKIIYLLNGLKIYQLDFVLP